MWGTKGCLGLPHGIPGGGGAKYLPAFATIRNRVQYVLQEPECPGSHAIYRQDVESPVPVQGIVRLMEIQGNVAKDRLTRGCYLMEQLSIGYGSTRTTS